MMYNEKSEKSRNNFNLCIPPQYLHPKQYLTYYTAPQYYAQAMGGPTQDYGQHAGNQYYQPQPQVYGSHHDDSLAEMLIPYLQGQHPGYGPVSYYPGPQPQTYDYQRRKEGFDALDQFFGEVKRRQFVPNDYQSVTRRLFELQGLQLPLITQQPVTSIPAYQPVSALGGGYHDADPIQSYSLPPMGNAKTREDLTSIDQILEQMQATIYENDTHLAQAGLSQPGSTYVGYHTGNSPPTTLPSMHAQNAGMARSHQNSMSGTDSASTPGLTPPSSAQSYTSGQSPMTGHAAPSSGAMYPNLPAGDMGYPGGNGATLGGAYDNEDPRRRYSGGMLQRAQPGKGERSEGSVTPPAAEMNKKAATKGKKKGTANESAIDPALSGEGTPGSKGEMSKEEADRQTNWVENMRLIEWMREMIKKKLETAKFDANGEEVKHADDIEMGGTDEETKQDEERLYPVLEAVKAA
jgi:hypothetical protein